ncbi:MAG TPA: hypothetical protein VJA21_19475 [Verrucomicrobiae bacterium]
MKKLNSRKVADIWRKNARQFGFKSVRRRSIQSSISQATAACNQGAKQDLFPWLHCYDEALCWINNLKIWVFWKQSVEPEPSRIPIYMLISKCCTFLVGIRHLVVSGLNDPACSLARTLHESLGLILAMLVDESIRERYDRSMDDKDSSAFWKTFCWRKQKGTGTSLVHEHLKKAGLRAGMSATEVEAWLKRHLENKQAFSGSTHVAIQSAWQCAFVSSLSHRSMLSTSSFGHVSVHSPTLLMHLAEALWDFGGIFMSIIDNETQVKGFEIGPKDLKAVEFQSMLVAFFTLQQLLTEEELPPCPQLGEVDELETSLPKGSSENDCELN